MAGKRYGLDYDKLLGETEALMEAQGIRLTPASNTIAQKAAKLHGLGEDAAESVARGIRRHHKAKHGKSRGRPHEGRAEQVYPGLGVLYEVLDHHLDIINRTYGLPLSPSQRHDLDALCEEIRTRLKTRLEALNQGPVEKLELQVRRDVVDLQAMINPGELIERERRRVSKLLEELSDILTVKDMG